MKSVVIVRTMISVLLAAVILTSCEDFLEKDRPDSVVKDEAIKNLEDARVALNGVYSGFKSTGYYGRYFVVHADVLTDELQSVIGYTNQLGEFYKWSFLSDNGEITSAWSAMYAVIVRACNIIDALPGIEGEVSELNRIEGQARLARALAHFDLVKAFAKAYLHSDPVNDPGVPIIEHFSVSEPDRNTIEEVYAFIQDEAESARRLLSGSTGDQAGSVFLSAAAADALMARVCLYMGDYDNAITYATRVIDNNSYSLARDSSTYARMFLNDEGSEIIFKVGLTRSDFNGRYIGYNYYNNSQGLPNPDYIPARWILDLFGENDYRYDIVFKNENTTNGWSWPLVFKYPGNPLFYSSDITTNANMYKVFRLSEMYLIRAEAFAEMGLDNIALTDYNTLRSARIEDYTSQQLSGQALKDAIWEERIREFCFEGHYFWDLKRNGKGFRREPIIHPEEGTITNPGPNQNELQVDPDHFRWIWPIPDAELRANSNITPNPGY